MEVELNLTLQIVALKKINGNMLSLSCDHRALDKADSRRTHWLVHYVSHNTNDCVIFDTPLPRRVKYFIFAYMFNYLRLFAMNLFHHWNQSVCVTEFCIHCILFSIHIWRKKKKNTSNGRNGTWNHKNKTEITNKHMQLYWDEIINRPVRLNTRYNTV